jgi:hypothetical protein
MFRNLLVICISLALSISFAAAQDGSPSPDTLSAAKIVDKNIASGVG